MVTQEYLAIGEAPDQVRNCYQQRSRWCKGHFQIFFNKSHCPAIQTKLSVRPFPQLSGSNDVSLNPRPRVFPENVSLYS